MGIDAAVGVCPLEALAVFLGLAAFMVFKPLGSAGSPDEPPPPTAVM